MPGTAIFWTTISSLFLIAGIATLVGRPFALFFPDALRSRVRFYLAPALGLAAILLFIAVLGRYFPFADSVVFPLETALAVAIALVLESRPRTALAHAGLVGVYAVFTAGTMLVPLLLLGGYNSFNDAFTYLAQGDWLQAHAFNETIPIEQVTAPLTQISLYQHFGFRMGGSYLLGLFQSLLNIRWSYDVYPAIVFAPVCATCLACGFPLARVLTRYSRAARLAILSLPAYSLGGVVFAASYGFLPQSYGQMFAAAAVFSYGALLSFLTDPARPLAQRMMASVPTAMLIAASVFSYSELSPFLLFSLAAATLAFAALKRTLLPYLIFGLLTAVLSAMLLNVEILRTVQAIMVQKDAVVGSPVDWPLIAYLAHALGTHGGAWDIQQWARRPLHWGSLGFVVGAAATLLLLAILLLNARRLRAPLLSGAFLPAAAMLGIFVVAFAHFRYGLASPFAVGTGQSWSQFKIVDWAQPLVFTLLALAIVPMLSRTRQRRAIAMVVAAVVVAAGGVAAVTRTAPIQSEYAGIRNLKDYYLAVRAAVASQCPAAPAVYLDLDRSSQKLRQTLTLFLADRRLKADWRGDDYIEAHLPPARLQEFSAKGDCYVEATADHPGEGGATAGKLRVGVYQGGIKVKVTRIDNDYEREGDADSWWIWVKRQVTFHTELNGESESALALEIRFTIGIPTSQTVTVTTVNAAGRSGPSSFSLPNGDHDIALPADASVTAVELTTDNTEPLRLSAGDDRVVNFIVRNFRIVNRAPGKK